MSNLRPTVKFLGLPIIFVAWIFYRLSYETYVDTQTFTEFWEDL